MLVFLAIILFLILLSSLLNTWLLFKLLPTEKQKEILRKIEPIKSEVREWIPPETAEKKVFRETLEKIKK